ncbi:S-layer homology domain-containing protein [Aminipila butyrica]|uniref:S-layer homology domain-containing protein n=1 Tax=Aminipila butyrica TaxID=433296 RepID=A0A858BQJ6_9FIRM|nr:S-layer homology domain-containing protein [Aminipila butyrica]QIB68141.1 S-layer homology domain-containing protein [Aminipila butyrica]
MKKRVLAMTLSAVMALTVNVGFASAGTDKFTDLNGHWGQAIINEAASLGVVGGYPEGYYLPDNLMKREEFYKLITNVLTTIPETSGTVLSFRDVDPIEWYVPTVKIAVAAGIAKGYEDGTFGVGQMISRQEAAKVVASVISTNNLDTSKNASGVKDVSLIGDWALPYVNIMFQKGYMQGDDQGNFRPTTALTRAEAATLLLNVKKNESVIKGPGVTGSGTTVTPPTTSTGIAVCQPSHAVTAGAFTVGEGTAKNPYKISTAAQLDHIRKHLSEGGYYILTQDIKVSEDLATTAPAAGNNLPDWSEGNFEPIGTESSPFVGHLDGDGHTISGLEISGTVKGQADMGNIASNAGLFGYVDAKSSVENLTLDRSSIIGAVNVGGIAGYNKGSLINCVLGDGSSVSGQTNVGGIAGYSANLMKSDINKGKVQGTVNTGGIVGQIDLDGKALYSCVNKGTVSGKSKTGGVVGYMPASSASMTIESCSNSGEVSSTANYAGGVAGQVDGNTYGVYVTDCYNTGALSGEGSSGGVVGYARGSRTKISDCYNTGAVNGKNSGGIVGNNEGDVELCYNKGRIVADSEAGGIVAYQNTGEGRIQNCYNMANVTANSNAGGIAGLSKDKIFNVYNSGTVKATNTAGGLVGTNYAAIQRSYNAGEVNGTNGAGALVGRNRDKLTNCFWLLGTSDASIGYEDSGSEKSIVMVLSKEQLSGQLKVKLGNGYQLLTNYLNDKAGSKVWTYTYRVDEAASGESSNIISDGGGVVPPISISTTEDKGNVIATSDLKSAYLYPELVEVLR